VPVPVEPPLEVPQTLSEAYALLASNAPTPIAGGTDLMVRITGEIGTPPERVIDLWRLDELRGIRVDDGVLTLGALTTYTDIRRSGAIHDAIPVLQDVAATIGAVQIQNRGTLGGNIANASPAGDTLPVLLAVDATIVVGGPRGEREVRAEDFWVAYRTTALAADELILRIRIPLPADRQVAFRKVGTRRAQAISKVVMAVAWRQAEPRGAWRDVRVGIGSVADRPIRARDTEAILEGARPTVETADAAAAAVAAEVRPIDDVRSTADYRRMVSARILHRIIRDAGGW
jgi:carbon-monoxide dehydrogenase medium subunit